MSRKNYYLPHIYYFSRWKYYYLYFSIRAKKIVFMLRDTIFTLKKFLYVPRDTYLCWEIWYLPHGIRVIARSRYQKRISPMITSFKKKLKNCVLKNFIFKDQTLKAPHPPPPKIKNKRKIETPLVLISHF